MQAQTTGCASWFIRDRRLRSGWRVLLYIPTIRIVQVGFLVGLLLLSTVLMLTLTHQPVSPDEVSRALIEVSSNLVAVSPLGLGARVLDTVVVLGVIWLFRRLIDRRSFTSLGFQLTPGWWREALAGFMFAVVAWVVIFLAGLTFGAVAITGVAWSTENWIGVVAALIGGLVFNLLVGIAEEADARGYMLQNLAEGVHFVPAVLISSIYFSVIHLLNPGAGITSAVGIFFAGVLLALGYFVTRRLWFSIGMHAAWNFAQGPVFGFLVSGVDMGGLLDLKITGPDWLMGGGFGPEAGALAVTVEIVMITVLFIFWMRGAPSAGKRLA